MTFDATQPDYSEGAHHRVYTTHFSNPARARTFVWAEARWYEREESVVGTGAVDFSPVADTDEELRGWLRESDLDIDELDDGDFYVMVLDEFKNQLSLPPEAPELSEEPRERQPMSRG